mgnify:CR=1 FL=1
MIARPITIPAAPPRPWTSRAATSSSILPASVAVTLAATNSTAPITSGTTRPARSDHGPKTSCPAPAPIRNAVSDSCTPVAVVDSSVVITGNAGRYRSIPNEASPISSASVDNSPAPIALPAAWTGVPAACRPVPVSVIPARLFLKL